MNELRFAGVLPLWLAITLAVLGALLAWLYYRREVNRGFFAWLLPTLRALAVLLILLMLAGPELVHTTGEEHRGKVLILVDASRSMGVTDEQMPLGEKLLIAQQLGLTDLKGIDVHLAQAAGLLDRAAILCRDSAAVEQDAKAAASAVAALTREAYDALEATDKVLASELDESVVDSAHQVADDADDRGASQVASDLAVLADPLASWRDRLSQRFDQQANEQLAQGGGGVEEIIAAFDAMSRLDRAGQTLLNLDHGQLARLTDDHDVALVVLSGQESQPLWASGDANDMPSAFPGTPDAGATDLTTVLERELNRQGDSEHLAVILVTDGRQNLGPALNDVADQARDRGVALHALAVGTTHRPHDLSVVDVKHPASVFPEGVVNGSVTLVDSMPPGRPFSIQVVAEDEVLWETRQVTIGDASVRQITFSFPIEAALERAQLELQQGAPELTVNHLAVPMEVRVVGLEGDREAGNDAMDFQVRAVMGKRKMLILAGRPRWEMHYIDTMFRRDPRWEVTTLNRLATADDIPRGEEGDVFPVSREQLFSYDIVVLGEIPPGTFNDRELGWLYDFVADRAGGMVVVDGRRGHFASYGNSPLGPLLPTRLEERGRRPRSLVLTAPGRADPALRLEEGEQENEQTWEGLIPPSYVAPIELIEGLDTVLVEAIVGREGDERWPAVVTRRVGAGWVWYSAFDETWRWRRNHESLYQERYWHQLTHRVVEPLYAAEDAYVSLGVDQVVVEAGGQIPVRVRIRDSVGRPRSDASAVCYLVDGEGRRAAQITLEPDSVEGGRYTGAFDADPRNLPPGVYKVAVSVEGVSQSDMLATTLVSIRSSGEVSGELADLTLNTDLLSQATQIAGGRLLYEYQADQIPELLEGLSTSTKQESVTALWQSWPWFGAVVCLLSIELLIRRRLGMV